MDQTQPGDVLAEKRRRVNMAAGDFRADMQFRSALSPVMQQRLADYEANAKAKFDKAGMNGQHTECVFDLEQNAIRGGVVKANRPAL